MNNQQIPILLSEFSNILDSKCMTCLVDNRGTIKDLIYNPYSNIGLLMKDLLVKGHSIRNYFDIPQDLGFFKVLMNPNSPSLPAKPGIFTFNGEPEEHYASIPNFYLKPAVMDNGFLYCLIYPARYLTEIWGATDRFGYFCVNDKEELTAFNRHFGDMTIASSLYGPGLLGTSVAEFISPTPAAMQMEELNGSDTLPVLKMDPILEWEFPKTNAVPDNLRYRGNGVSFSNGLSWKPAGPMEGWLLIDKVFEWDEFDIRLDITLEKGVLPGLLLGEPPLETGYFSDRDGYLMGQHAGGYGLFLKKGGETQDLQNCAPQSMTPGTYHYCKSGNCFLIYKNNKRIFGYYENDIMPRAATYPMLFQRAGDSCVIRKMALFLIPRNMPHKRKNSFVRSIFAKGDYHLLTRVRRIYVAADQSYHTLYQLRNLTDLKRNMEELEESLKAKERTAERAQRRLKAFTSETSAFIGESRVMRQIREKAEQIAGNRATVLIEGETGTGKEVLARYLHAMSPRSNESFVKVDCSTLPATLMESLLFGHEKGAFTGATETRTGLFEQANRGTLFLDEAGNLPLNVQAKLLQFMQDQTLTPVGAHAPVRLDVRIVVASNIPLKDLVAKGLFREDLYYRIAVLDVHLPPLRERLEDLPVLTAFFLRELNTRYAKNIHALTSDAYQQMYAYAWPGNIRELKNVLEKAYLFCSTTEIESLVFPGLPSVKAGEYNFLHNKRKPMRFLNKSLEEVQQEISRNSGNIKATAEELNVSMRVLYYFLNKHNIKPNDLRKNPRKQRSGD